MDRIVCLIVLTVVASLVFEISSAAAIAIPEVQNDDNQSVQKPQSKADVELVQPVDTERTYYSANQRPARRNQLFDNIFRIPISTLSAVNDLLQGITGNFGSG